MRAANLFFALCYALSVAVQYNDPDPLPWMAIYAAAAATTLAWERGRGVRAPALILLALSAAWAAWILARLELGVPLAEALGDWGMHGQGSEEAREIGGLAFVAAWMAALAARPERGD